jgi:hypothetical protein
MGTFPINNHYSFVLFDTGADKSFVSIEFVKFIGLELSTAPEPYSIELENDKLLEANFVALGCSLNLHDHLFPIDLMPFELGSFDIVIGMDWLSADKDEIVCGEKMVRIPLPEGQLLEIHGERPGKVLRIILCMKARKYLLGQYQAFLAQIVEKKPEGKKISEILIVKDFPDAFPEDVFVLPPVRR